MNRQGKEMNRNKVETFNVILVAKRYTQKYEINYEKTFFLAAKIKSIHIPLFIVVALGYKIWQMDIKTSFLNDNLDENVYMMQLEGFV